MEAPVGAGTRSWGLIPPRVTGRKTVVSFAALTTRLLLGLLALAAAAGCKAKIGDACQRSTDCSIRGDRSCDLSHRVTKAGIESPGAGAGECTIEGCGADSCPKEAECVKVYGSDFLTVACDPAREDRAIEGEGEGCLKRACIDPPIDDAECNALCPADSEEPDCISVCPPRDDCQPREVCLPEGLCVDEITARTSCRRRCKDDGDCRNGYECIRTGSRGIYAAPDLDTPGEIDDFRVCAPVSQ